MLFPTFPRVLLIFLSREEALVFLQKKPESELTKLLKPSIMRNDLVGLTKSQFLPVSHVTVIATERTVMALIGQ